MSKTTNERLQELIHALKARSGEEKQPLWKTIALELESPRRRRREVNLYRIDKYTREGETAVVAGKVLGVGKLTKAHTVVAFEFSAGAIQKIELAKGKPVLLKTLLSQKESPKKMRMIG